MKIKIPMIILVIAFSLFTFVGCGNQQGENLSPTETPSPTDSISPTEAPDTDEDDDKTTEGSTETPTPTPEPEPEPTPTPESHEHNYVGKVTKPTCTEKGYTTYTCECGDSYVGNPIDALGHSFTSYWYNNDATMEKDGTKSSECDNGCGKINTVVAKGTKIASQWTDCNKTMYVLPPAGDSISLNDGPGGNRLCSLPAGTKVTVISVNEKDDWCRIKYNGQEGYVVYSALTDTEPTPTPETEPQPTPTPEPEPDIEKVLISINETDIEVPAPGYVNHFTLEPVEIEKVYCDGNKVYMWCTLHFENAIPMFDSYLDATYGNNWKFVSDANGVIQRTSYLAYQIYTRSGLEKIIYVEIPFTH